MADERGVAVPKGCDWATLKGYSGNALTDHYGEIVRNLREAQATMSNMSSNCLSVVASDISTLLALDRIDEWCFVSKTPDLNRRGSVYGGQLLAQAAQAAAALVGNGNLTHLHGLFLKGATAEHPVEYRVEALQQGRRYSSFRILGLQPGRKVVDVRAVFQTQVQNSTLEHSMELTKSYRCPEECPTFDMLNDTYAEELAASNCKLQEKNTLEVRLIEPENYLFKCAEKPEFAIWVRPRALVTETSQRCLATVYLSDYLVGLCSHLFHRPLVEAWNGLFGVSIDHSIWLHTPPNENEWLLFVTNSPDSRNGRALCRGSIYGRDGRNIATMVQEFTVPMPS